MVPSRQPEPQAHCNLSVSPDARHSPGSGYLQQEQHWCSPLSHTTCVPSGRGHRKMRAFPRVTCGSEASTKDFGWLKSPIYSAQLSTLLWVPVWQQCLMQTAKNNHPFYTEGETEAQQHSQTCFAGLQLSVQLSSSLTALVWLSNSTVTLGSQKTLLRSVVWQETGKKSTRMLILTCSCGVHQQWVCEPPCWLPSRPWRAMHVCTSWLEQRGEQIWEAEESPGFCNRKGSEHYLYQESNLERGYQQTSADCGPLLALGPPHPGTSTSPQPQHGSSTLSSCGMPRWPQPGGSQPGALL